MKIGICNVPLRGDKEKTVYPPLSVLAVMQSLRLAGYNNCGFYDINFFRPDEQALKNHFLREQYDIAGISASVSTSYKFVKKLAALIKSVSPRTIIVLGGALSVSSEVILKFVKEIDYCVVGEGEKTIIDLVNYIRSYGLGKSEEKLKTVKGLCFLNDKGEVVFTGYQDQLKVDEITDPDYGIIERYSDVNQYIITPFIFEQFRCDERTYERGRKDKRLATVVSSRGCVHRCTFCYRWQRGIRVFPVDRVIRHIRYLIEKYNVGFVSFGDENFGAAKRWIEEFIEQIKPLDILYRIAGICCENVSLPLLRQLKNSGCVALHYGFESGSDKILKVMEKKADVQRNLETARWTHEAGLQTVPALVVGMPGESYKTIGETTDFVNKITEFWPRDPIISINALVPLPGAPVYEYARYRGVIGKTLEDEERYLLGVSDQSGASLRHINLTDYPYFIVLGWIRCICWAARYNYYRKHDVASLSSLQLFSRLLGVLFKRRQIDRALREGIYGNSLFYHARYFIAPLYIMCKQAKADKQLFFYRCKELAVFPFRRRPFNDYVSLRQLLLERVGYLKEAPADSVQGLRVGR